MHLIRPKRWTAKPEGAYCIDWGHPLATGLKSLILFNMVGGGSGGAGGLPILWDGAVNGLGKRNSINGGLVGGTWAYHSQYGAGINFGASDYADIGVGPQYVHALNGITQLMIRRKTDLTLRTGVLFGDNSQHDGCHFPFTDGNVYWDFGGASAPQRLTITGQSWNTSVDVCAFTAGGKGSAVYRNGIKIGSQSTALTSVLSSGVWLINSGNSGTNDGDAQELYYAATCNVQWDEGMVKWWMAEPYAMLIPQAPLRRYFFVPTPAIQKRRRVFVVT